MSALVSARLSLLLDDDIAALPGIRAQLQELLPTIDVDRLVQAHPNVLDVHDFELALQVRGDGGR